MLDNKIKVEAATGGIKSTLHQALYDEVGWETLRSRREQHKLLLYHKMVHNDAPEYLSHLVPSMVDKNHGYSTRQSEQTDYNLSNCRLELYCTSFLPDTVRLWNLLPNDIKDISNFYLFKTVIQKQSQKRKTNVLLLK